MDEFDKAAERFLRRTRNTAPKWDQVAAVAACLLQQMGEEEQAKAQRITEGVFAFSVASSLGRHRGDAGSLTA